MIWVGLLTLLGALPLISATCGQPDIPPNALLTYKKGIIRGNIFLEDSEVLFVYSTSDGKAYLHSFCQNGNWTEPIPINVTLCGEPTDPANRTLLAIHSDYVNPVKGTYYEGTRVYLRCELQHGSRIAHHPMVCQANGEWTQTARCEVTCPPLRLREEDEKRNLTYNTSLLTDELHSRKGYSVNTIVSFRCVPVIFTAQSHKDYESSAEWSSVTCKSSGKWSEWTSTCDSACDKPDIPTNGRLHSIAKFKYPNGKYPEHTEAIFQYQTGNETTFHHSFCRYGRWNKLIPLNARCGLPPELPNQTLPEISLRTGDRVNGKYREGTEAYYYPCELGNGSRILLHICQANGEWTDSRCQATCPHLMEIENGEVDYNTHILTSVLRYPVNTVVSFSCDAGYYSSYYFNSATCKNSGNWSKQAPMCLEVSCPHLRLTHGTVFYNTSLKNANGQLPWTSVTGYRVNTLAFFLCDKDFRREGSSSAICQSSGKWTEEAPRCTATPCLKPTVENGYFTVILHVYPPPNDTFFLRHTYLAFGCDPGFTFSYTPQLTYSYCSPNGNWKPPIPSCILQEE